MIVNWKKNKSEIISSIYEFTSLSQKKLAWVNDNNKVIDERVYEWFANTHCRNIPISGPILQTKAIQVVAALVWTISGHRMVGWRCFTSTTIYNSVCCLEKALEWTKMSSTTRNRTCPTLFKAMTQGVSGTWTKLDLFGKECQTVAWYYKEKSAKQASWPRRTYHCFFLFSN
jgi:hypothetical protein